jgi:hypothetical protein
MMDDIMEALREDVRRLHARIEQLQADNVLLGRRLAEREADVETWKDRYESEKRDHLATLEHCDLELQRASREHPPWD